MDLLCYGVPFHAVIVFGLGPDFSFKSILTRCEVSCSKLTIEGFFVVFILTQDLLLLGFRNLKTDI